MSCLACIVGNFGQVLVGKMVLRSTDTKRTLSKVRIAITQLRLSIKELLTRRPKMGDVHLVGRNCPCFIATYYRARAQCLDRRELLYKDILILHTLGSQR